MAVSDAVQFSWHWFGELQLELTFDRYTTLKIFTESQYQYVHAYDEHVDNVLLHTSSHTLVQQLLV